MPTPPRPRPMAPHVYQQPATSLIARCRCALCLCVSPRLAGTRASGDHCLSCPRRRAVHGGEGSTGRMPAGGRGWGTRHDRRRESARALTVAMGRSQQAYIQYRTLLSASHSHSQRARPVLGSILLLPLHCTGLCSATVHSQALYCTGADGEMELGFPLDIRVRHRIVLYSCSFLSCCAVLLYVLPARSSSSCTHARCTSWSVLWTVVLKRCVPWMVLLRRRARGSSSMSGTV